ncbi:hypothetical protein D3C75_1155510 [compost metagenome]
MVAIALVVIDPQAQRQGQLRGQGPFVLDEEGALPDIEGFGHVVARAGVDVLQAVLDPLAAENQVVIA